MLNTLRGKELAAHAGTDIDSHPGNLIMLRNLQAPYGVHMGAATRSPLVSGLIPPPGSGTPALQPSRAPVLPLSRSEAYVSLLFVVL
jgi:hypothetical protein